MKDIEDRIRKRDRDRTSNMKFSLDSSLILRGTLAIIGAWFGADLGGTFVYVSNKWVIQYNTRVFPFLFFFILCSCATNQASELNCSYGAEESWRDSVQRSLVMFTYSTLELLSLTKQASKQARERERASEQEGRKNRSIIELDSHRCDQFVRDACLSSFDCTSRGSSFQKKLLLPKLLVCAILFCDLLRVKSRQVCNVLGNQL